MADFKLHPADIKHLRKDELEHEVFKFGVTPATTVDELRIQLRDLLHKQRRGSLQTPPRKVNITEEDALKIEETISTLSDNIELLNDKNFKKESNRIEVRLGHYLLRVSEWPDTDEAIKTIKLRTINIIKQFLKRLEDKSDELNEDSIENKQVESDSDDENDQQDHESLSNDNDRNINLGNLFEERPQHISDGNPFEINNFAEQNYLEQTTDMPNAIIDHDNTHLNQFRQEIRDRLDNLPISVPQGSSFQRSTPHNRIRSNNISTRDQRIPKVYKWKIKFTGDSNSMSVARFLELVDIRRCAEKLTYDDIFPSAADLFDETALTWYMAHRHTFLNWRDLENKLHTSFTHHLSKVQLWKEIMNCKQKDDESVIAYVSKLRILFSRLPVQVDEGLKMETVLINALPKYHEKLHFISIHNLNELETSMLKLESTAQPLCNNDFDNKSKPSIKRTNQEFNYKPHAERIPNVHSQNLRNKPSHYYPMQRPKYFSEQHGNQYQYHQQHSNQRTLPNYYNNNSQKHYYQRNDQQRNSAMNSAQPQYRAQPPRGNYQQHSQQSFNPRNNNNTNQQYRYSANNNGSYRYSDNQQSRKNNLDSRGTNFQGKVTTQFGQTETQLGETSRK